MLISFDFPFRGSKMCAYLLGDSLCCVPFSSFCSILFLYVPFALGSFLILFDQNVCARVEGSGNVGSGH